MIFAVGTVENIVGREKNVGYLSFISLGCSQNLPKHKHT